MNITKEIGEELGLVEFLSKTPEIQIYSNHNCFKYLWCDNRYVETSDVWKNIHYDSRSELKIGLINYLKSNCDI